MIVVAKIGTSSVTDAEGQVSTDGGGQALRRGRPPSAAMATRS